MAVAVAFKVGASNGNLGANGSVTATGLTTSGASLILISASVGNNSLSTVSGVTVGGSAATLGKRQVMPDAFSNAEVWWFWSTGALASVSVVVTFANSAGAGTNIDICEATGTDSSSIGNVGGANGTSGTSAASAVCSATGSVMYASSLNFGSSGTEAAGTNTTLLNAQNDGAGDFAASSINNQATSSGTTYTVTTTHTSGQWGMAVVEVKPAGSGGAITTLSDEGPPRRPSSQSTGDRQAEQWTLQPLASSQPVKSFLATEGMDRRPASAPRHTSVPWVLTALAAPTIKPWCDLAPPARVPPWARPRILEPDASMRALGQSSPVQTFLHQHPAIAPPWRGPRPQQQPWVASPILATLNSVLLNDEAQIIRPRRIRRWAPMGALARASAAVEIFPFAPDATGRFLVTAQGAPVPIIGRTAWGIQALNSTDRAEFLDDTVARGFTAIECQIPGNLANIFNNPFDANGNLPFDKLLDTSTWTTGSFAGSKPDLSTPNAAFWGNVDNIVADCRSRRLRMDWFGSYLGIDSSEGWKDTMTANGSTKTQAYAAFLATRYKPQPHIVWCTAGDTASGFTEELDYITGIQSVSGQRSGPQFSAERNGGSISSDGTGALGAAMTENGAYDWGTAIAQCRRAYAFGTTTRAIPAYLIEGPYDEEGPDGTGVNTIATQPVRRWPWWAIIETINGFIQGNGYIWPFHPTGSTPPSANDNWKNHKGTQTTQDITRLAAFWKSIAWWTLVPSGQGSIGTLITSGAGTPDNDNYVASACNPAGTLWVAYAGPSRASTITVDMTKMSGTALARWWNPSTAAFTTVGSFANTGTHVFTWPGDNGTGFSDWVLVMTA